MPKEVVIPWSPDPETNRRNIQDALDGGATVINGEMDEEGNPKVYEITTLPTSQA